MLTARDSVPDRIRGLDDGADDYVVKPFAFSELLSRVRAVIRRGRPARPVVLRCGPLALDPATRTTVVGDTDVPLSPREFALLEMLLDRRGAVVTRTELLDHVWDSSYDGVSNVVDVYVRSLRDKIDRRFGVQLLHTVRGAGYRVTDSP
jgi:DNA-binding response OmpR family regulator